MPPKPVRTSRIQARIAPDALKVIKRAAEIQGRSVSDFVVAAAQEVATRTIEDAQIIRLSVEVQRNLRSPSLGNKERMVAVSDFSGLGRKITKWAMESMLRPLDRDNFVTIANKKHCSHVSTLGTHVLLR